MRIDKYLKNARIIKRRTVGKDACDGGRISINDKVAKPGDQV
ncbi:MAG TPA: RNA-binding protein, partial [Acetobacterium sp.]|nr:RNA-binding protein [Acetobacterium sp.]